MPAIIHAGWFGPAAAAYLGAANLAGYLAGALLGRPISRRLTVPGTLRVMMLVATAAFFGCAYPVSFGWYFGWRFAAGLAGGSLMVLAAPTVLPHIAPSRRGLAGGLIFMGIGVGVVASGTLVPLLLEQGVRSAWIGLGVISLVLTLAAWGGWPGDAAPGQVHAASPHSLQPTRLRALYVEYALNAAGWVPHMVFLVDFVARGLGKGIAIGSEYWVIFGLGATFGPILTGHLADRAGFGPALRLAFLIEAGAVIVPALGAGPAWLALSSLVVGAFVTGTVPLVLGRIGELLPDHPARQKAAWSIATTGFALCQAAAAYGLTFVFSRSGGNYALLFLIGTAAMVVALAIDLVAAVTSRRGAIG